MAYSELIKNFDKIRSYMRDFFIYGFKTREEYDRKSARSYDNERRRIQSYLGDLVAFRQTPSGKNMFISLEGRSTAHNPLYQAFKSKSFTDMDITLHFMVMDILADGSRHTLKELLYIMDTEYLPAFERPLSFDESTLRKKMKEYEELGFVVSEKEGKTVKYCLSRDEQKLEDYRESLRFFTEESPLGIVGSYLEDKIGPAQEYLSFKNHYIMNAYDAEIIEAVLQGIHEKRWIEIDNFGKKSNKEKCWRVIPLKLYFSVQGGRNYLMCMENVKHQFMSFRLDYIQKVRVRENCSCYDEIRESFEKKAKNMWGVARPDGRKLEHIEMDIQVGPDEKHIVNRLEREKRCGMVSRIDETTYRFSADVQDTIEMVPWIRTFFGRIKAVRCDNVEVMNKLKYDIVKMAEKYEVL